MRKIWLALVLVALTGGFGLGVQPARAAVPTITPDDRVLGKPDAPITIFEFFSLTCPHCADFAARTLPKVKAQWIETGKAKLVYRPYPLDRNALKAEMIARCAPPERYPAFVETLFQQQQVWGIANDPAPALRRIATLGGLSPEQFDKCFNDEELSKQIVAAEYQAQKDYGVNSTPTFFVNGTKAVGEMSYDEFAKLLAGQDPGPLSGASSPAPSASPSGTAASSTWQDWMNGIIAKFKSWFS